MVAEAKKREKCIQIPRKTDVACIIGKETPSKGRPQECLMTEEDVWVNRMLSGSCVQTESGESYIYVTEFRALSKWREELVLRVKRGPERWLQG